MKTTVLMPAALCMSILALSCGSSPEKEEKAKNDSAATHQGPAAVSTGDGQQLELPAPFATKSTVNFSDVLMDRTASCCKRPQQ